MVAEADIPHGGEAGLHGAPRQFRGLQQRDSRGFLLDGRNDIGFCTQAKVDMAIDETRKNRQATAVDALCPSRQTYGLIRSGSHNAIAFNHDRAALNLAALAVQDTNLSDGDGHGASLMGMVTMTPPMMSLSL